MEPYTLKVDQITEINNLNALSFSDPLNQYGFFFDLTKYKLNEEGAITLSFNSEIEHLLGESFRFSGKMAQINDIKDNKELRTYLPDFETETDFKYKIVNKKHLIMYFNKKLQQEENKKQVILVNLQFKYPHTIKGQLSASVISETISLNGNKGDGHVIFREDELRENIPYFVRIERGIKEPTLHTLVYTDKLVNVYHGSLLNQSFESENIFSIETTSKSQVIMLEFFGPYEKLFQYQLEETTANVKKTKIESLSKSITLGCKSNNGTEYLAGIFKEGIDHSQYYIYINHDIRYFEFFFSNLREIDGSQESILPKEDQYLILPEVVTTPIFLIKMVCKSFRTSELRFIQDVKDPIIPVKNDTKSEELILQETEYVIELPISEESGVPKGSNYEFRLGQTEDEDAEIHISTETTRETKRLDKDNKVARFMNVTNNIKINNVKGQAVISMNLAQSNSKEITSISGLIKETNFYYKLQNHTIKQYKYTFHTVKTRRLTDSMAYNNTKAESISTGIFYRNSSGKDGFIPDGDTELVDGQVIEFNNPMVNIKDLLEGEFFYMGFTQPEESNGFYLKDFSVSLSNKLIEPEKMIPLSGKSLISLEFNGKNDSNNLVIFLAKCSKEKYTIKLSKDGEDFVSNKGEEMRELFIFADPAINADFQYDNPDNSNQNYYFSYSYMNEQLSDTIKEAIDNNNNNLAFDQLSKKLSWNNPASPILKHQIYLSKKNDNINLSSECDMLTSGKKVAEIAASNQAVLTDSEPGIYIVNVLAVNDADIPYYIAYKAMEIEIIEPKEIDRTFWIYMGIAAAIIVIAIIGSAIYYIKKNKSYAILSKMTLESQNL